MPERPISGFGVRIGAVVDLVRIRLDELVHSQPDRRLGALLRGDAKACALRRVLRPCKRLGGRAS